MHIVLMKHTRMIIIGILFLYPSVSAVLIGRVPDARFTSVNRLNEDSIWLSTFNTWVQCLCTVLSSNFSSNAITLNMYQNGSCQVLVALPTAYTIEINKNSTLILLKQLPPTDLAPCCSNLSWLITRINASQQTSANVTKPTFLLIDDNDFLVTVSYRGPLVQLNRTTLSIIQSTLIVNNATSISYRNGFYYLPDCPSNCTVNILSMNNLSLISSISLSTSIVREIIFVRNSSLMLIASNDKNQILFFDVFSSKNYTPSIPSSISINRPCGLYAVNDSFIYIAPWYSSTTLTPVSTMVFSNNTWVLSTLPNTTPTGTQKVFQTTVDSCGRLWLAVTGFGIRIFDPWGYTLLYEWPVTTGINGFLLLDNYELFIADYSANKILHFNPTIEQCTS